jgi:hypothetical protein
MSFLIDTKDDAQPLRLLMGNPDRIDRRPSRHA